MEEDVAHLRAAIEQLVVDPAARQQALDLLSRIERSSKRTAFSADRTRKEMEVQFHLLSRTTDDLRKALAETEQRVVERTRELQTARDELAELNRTLEQRVAEQVTQLERLGRLKRFFSPQLAELIWPATPRTRSRATGARSRWCSSTSAASPPSPRPPSPRRSWGCCASTTRPWASSSWRTRARSSASPATA